jgi:hypothetical protein
VIPPTGGTKDTKVPIVKKMIPAIGATNFKGGVILIEFNEEITVDPNPNNILISPNIEGKILFKDKKKKYLELTVPNTLKENTTYSISLNNVVKDITEGNTIKDITYAFSTGPLLDSLTLTGKIINIETKQPIKEAMIGLYEISDTLNIRKQKPLYLNYSDEKGIFKLSYLKQGDYYLLVLEDKNKNLSFDNQEKTDFIEQISINKEVNKTLLLELSISDTTGNKILSRKPEQQKQILTYRNGIKQYHFKTLNPEDKIYVVQEKKKAKELTVYPQLINDDTVTYILETIDSIGNYSIDTLKLNKLKRILKKEPSSINPTTKDIIPGLKKLSFTTNKPIKKINTDSIFINDSQEFRIEYKENYDSLFIYPAVGLLQQDSTKVKFKKGSLVFYDDDSLQQNSFIYRKADPSNYSVLEMKIQTKEQNYIIQLLTENYIVLDEYKNITILNFNYIKPGTYRIRAIIDKNANGYWDRSNPLKGIKAEPIYYYNSDKINLKPNWELKDLVFIF